MISVHTCTPDLQGGQKKVVGSPGTRDLAVNHYVVSRIDITYYPLEMQVVILSAEPSLQPSFIFFIRHSRRKGLES